MVRAAFLVDRDVAGAGEGSRASRATRRVGPAASRAATLIAKGAGPAEHLGDVRVAAGARIERDEMRAGVDEKVLADLISWGWLHHRAPMTPMLSDLNFRYHGRAIGASVPRTRENRATGFCAAHFPEQIGAELDGARTRTPGTEAADASIRGLFDRIRSALLDVLDPRPGGEIGMSHPAQEVVQLRAQLAVPHG